MGTKFLYTTEIKLVLFQTRLLYIKMLIIILRETTKKITKYIVKDTNRELKWHTKKYTTEGMGVMEEQRNKKT